MTAEELLKLCDEMIAENHQVGGWSRNATVARALRDHLRASQTPPQAQTVTREQIESALQQARVDWFNSESLDRDRRTEYEVNAILALLTEKPAPTPTGT